MKKKQFKEHDEKTLKRLQQVELDILKDFVAVCEKHDLIYFGIAGTGIGALRHKGFIPWDDDIDVAMPREDYDKLMVYMDEEFGDKYTVLNAERFPNYPLMTTRLCLKGTEFKEEALKSIDAPMGIFLDIYAYDKVSDDPKEAKKQAWDAWFWSKVLILRSIPFPMLGFTGIKKGIVHAICGLVHILMVIFRISKKWIHKKAYEATTRFNHYEKTEKWNYICDTNPYVSTYNVADIFPLQKLQYEDIMINFPGNIHNNLTNMYGDYMKLPPEEKRKNHYPYALKFLDE
ncbi:MAG: LicD family protein [Lachnospiraceae bacterium]|nr:LicD family protein [Lachnospiraceae bacterium]